MTAHRIQTEFQEICDQMEGTDKASHHGYHRFYPYFLAHLRDQAVRIVEIGVRNGASLRLWREYFREATCWGVEIAAKQELEEVEPGLFIVRGDQSDEQSLRRLVALVEQPVDVILDDGSHVPEHQLLSFEILFRQALKPGGCYIIEDIETSYWKRCKLYGYEINYGVGHPRSTVEVFRSLATVCNAEFYGHQRLTCDNVISYEAQDMIETITFAQNAIIITKRDPEAHGKYYGRTYKSGHRT